MGWELVARRFTKALADYIDSSGERWSDAVGKIANGNYQPDEMRTDVGDSVAELFGLWATLLASSPSPIVPVAAARIVAGDLVTSDASALAVVEKAIPTGATVEVSKLLLQGDPAKYLDAAAAAQGAMNDEVMVTITKTAAAPDAGLYHGIVLVNGAVAAAVVVEIVP